MITHDAVDFSPAALIGADRPALIEDGTGRTTTFAELDAAADGFAAALLADGLRPSEVVAVAMDNGPDFVVAFRGVLRAGGIILLLDPRAPDPVWERALTTGARRIVADHDLTPRLARLRLERTVAQVELRSPGQSTVDRTGGALPALPAPDLTAVLAASSGTGGRVKHAPLTHANLAANLGQIHARHLLTAQDIVVAVTPWRHIYGMQMAMNHTLAVGGRLVILDGRFELSRLLTAIHRHRITVAYLVPDTIIRLADHPLEGYDLSCLRAIFSGGAPLPTEVAAALSQRLGIPVLQGYGMTEAGCTHLVPDGVPAPMGSIGLPLPRTEVRIADPDTGMPVPVGRVGELWVRGPQVSPGYLDDPAATAELRTPDGWLRTGDLARVDDAGFCTITGRRKDMIKYKGYQVSPVELEAILLAHPDIREAAVVGVPDPICGELPKAFVVVERDLPEQAIFDHVAAQVAPQYRIRLVEQVATLPRNAMGKVIRTMLTSEVQAARGDDSVPLAGR
ncbi:MAG TPA: AMP-binding protein [Pseudonocardiaceae bacterium]|jgi:acyl-CoA synthetase (AMP-forming)/AMP-acid ligase II|nr:AMP-binding protein [Pseudonocardiaceae bacterium]